MNQHTGNLLIFENFILPIANNIYKITPPMLDHDALDTDSNIYEPWDFHDPWDSPVNFPLGGKSLLQQA